MLAALKRFSSRKFQAPFQRSPYTAFLRVNANICRPRWEVKLYLGLCHLPELRDHTRAPHTWRPVPWSCVALSWSRTMGTVLGRRHQKREKRAGRGCCASRLDEHTRARHLRSQFELLPCGKFTKICENKKKNLNAVAHSVQLSQF